MGIIREPDNIDFVFDPAPPTKGELKMISELIRESKEKNGVFTLEGIVAKKGSSSGKGNLEKLKSHL